MKLPKIKKLNAKGVSHHVLIAVLVIAGIAGFGGWRVYSSSAATAHCSGYSYRGGANLYNKAANLSGPATVKIYRKYVDNTASGVKWCAVMVSTGGAYGVAKPMKLRLDANNSTTDSGSFKYYAGPLYGSLRNGYPVGVYGEMTWKGKVYTSWTVQY